MAVKELVASGSLADIYLYDDKHVIKLYRIKDVEEIIGFYNKMVLLNDSSLPIPQAEGMKEEKGKQGIIFKYAKGDNFIDILLEKKDYKYCGSKLASFHKKIFNENIKGLPPYKEVMLKRIDQSVAPDECKAKARTMLELLPDGNYLCHGDFHPGNMILNNCRMSIIDWDYACIGPKEFDVAMTFTILNTECFVEKGIRSRNIRDVLEPVIKIYMKEIGYTMSNIEKYLYICFVARYTKYIDEKTESNINTYLNYIK